VPEGPRRAGPAPTRIRSLIERHWPVIAAATAVVFLASAAYTYTRPKVYSSSSSFLVQASYGGSGQPLEVLENVGEAASIETETRLLESERVVGPVVEKLGLNLRVGGREKSRPLRDVFPAFEISGQTEPGVYRITPREDGGFTVRDQEQQVVGDFAPGMDLVFSGLVLPPPVEPKELSVTVLPFRGMVQSVQGRITASADGKESDIIWLSCNGPTAASAHDLCVAVSESYVNLRKELQRAEATAAAKFLRGQVENAEKRLEAAEDSLGRYQERNLAIALDARANAAVDQEASFQAQRDQLEAERFALARLIDRIEAGGPSQSRDLASFPTFLRSGNPVIGDLLGTLVELDNQRAEMLKTRTERNPDVVAIDTRIVEIESELRSIAVTYEDALSTQIRSLGSMAGRAAGRASTIPGRQVESGRLQRQVALLDDLYRFLQTRLREAEIAESISMPSIQVVDRATMPTSPSSPNVRLNLALGLVMGLGFGILLALYRERSDTRIREPESLEHITGGIPVMAMIPQVGKSGPLLPVSRPSANGAPIAVKTRPTVEQEVAREAFRGLVADIQIAARNMRNGGIRSVAITSSSRGEGKTFSACNLALAQTNAAVRTLLIDADVRGKGVTRFFGLGTSRPGLPDVLTGTVRLDDALRPLTVGGRGELFVLPSGVLESDRPDPLDLESLANLIKEAESRFEMVIVDTPPLNVLSDAATVAASVDAVMVVVRGGSTDRGALDQTLDRLRRTQGRVMGIVLNDVELPEHYTSYSREVPDER
jgi:capsular exopolysaccharide synthesis family protein